MEKTRNEKDPLEVLLSGEKLTHTIKTRRGDFKIIFPLPKDLRQIELRVAEMLEGRPASGFSNVAINNFRAYATLDVLVIDAPDWFKNLETSEECADDALIKQIYRGYLRFYEETQKSLERGRCGNGVGKMQFKSKDEAVADSPLPGASD